MNAVTWGKLACIGCGTLDPDGTEKVTAAGHVYDTKILVNHLGQTDSKIWVSNELPYPVKAQAYAAVTTGQPPIQYSYDLIQTGTGAPRLPSTTSNIPHPPLTQATGRGTYQISVNWSPEVIHPGNATLFTIAFTDSKGVPQSSVNFDFKVTDSTNGTVIKELRNLFTGDANSKTVNATYNRAGPLTITITINSVQGIDMGAFIESADFNIVAVPEFPLGILLPIGAAGFAAIALLGSTRRVQRV